MKVIKNRSVSTVISAFLTTIIHTILVMGMAYIFFAKEYAEAVKILSLIHISFDKLMEGRTSFVVAHRLSTIRNASLILVMNEGKIIEQGSHEELLAKGGFYSKLYNSQFQAS